MLGLEDDAHRARSEPVEHAIVAQDQPMNRAGFEAVRLIFGEQGMFLKQGQQRRNIGTFKNGRLR